MKCKVCGAESGKYPLCRACNLKKEKGEIIKCPQCNEWHFVSSPCPTPKPVDENAFLYNVKRSLMSKAEQNFYHAISTSLPEGYRVFPQVNLTAFIVRTDNVPFRNELYRIVDFLITDSLYAPKLVVEINDQSHLNYDRKERDEKVRKICEEAGIPILKLWTSYGVNEKYIQEKIQAFLTAPPMQRVHHFVQQTSPQKAPSTNTASANTTSSPKSYQEHGCYVATCVYGSYDCPPVWTLRRYRDTVLLNSVIGRMFVRIYYRISPWLVKKFGSQSWFIKPCRSILNKIVARLNHTGFGNDPYTDVQ